MRESKGLETAVGLFVVAGVVALFFLAVRVSNLTNFSSSGGYHVTAEFGNVGGLKVGSAVTMGGVLVGRVTEIDYNQEIYEAVVTLVIGRQYDRIPSDSTASILTAGLLGEQYIGLQPGASEEYLRGGSEIKYTQSAIILERMISQFLLNQAAGEGKK